MAKSKQERKPKSEKENKPDSKHYKDEAAIKAFGERVRALRIEKGLTIEQLANSKNLHATQLSRVERGETNVTISYITKLAAALGVPARDLL